MKKKREDSIITLDDYQTFQYMIAPPSIAKHIINEITSFVFYNVPYIEGEMEQKRGGTFGVLFTVDCDVY